MAMSKIVSQHSHKKLERGGLVDYLRQLKSERYNYTVFLEYCCKYEYPSGHKKSLRRLRIVLRYIRRLHDKLTTSNCKSAQKCLEKRFSRRLIKMPM